MAETKKCAKCGQEKALTDFSRRRERAISQCKSCRNAYMGRWRAGLRMDHPPKPRTTTRLCKSCGEEKPAREFYRNRGRPVTACKPCFQANIAAARYGLTPSEYAAMLKAQGAACAVCKQAPQGKRRLAVDHCHSTGAVRGLLCHDCNVSLGFLREDVDRIIALARYISSFQEPECKTSEPVSSQPSTDSPSPA